MKNEPTPEDYRHRAYNRRVAGIVSGLHDLAEHIEREARPHKGTGVTGTPRYIAAAECVQHALVWGIANVGAHRLIESAHHADIADAEAEVSA